MSKNTSAKTGSKFLPGSSGNPAGRPKGTPNKSTREIRDAVQVIIEWAYTSEAGTPRAQQWIEQVAKDDPGKALTITLQLAELVMPKMQRMEIETKEKTQLVPPMVIVRFPSKDPNNPNPVDRPWDEVYPPGGGATNDDKSPRA